MVLKLFGLLPMLSLPVRRYPSMVLELVGLLPMQLLLSSSVLVCIVAWLLSGCCDFGYLWRTTSITWPTLGYAAGGDS